MVYWSPTGGRAAVRETVTLTALRETSKRVPPALEQPLGRGAGSALSLGPALSSRAALAAQCVIEANIRSMKSGTIEKVETWSWTGNYDYA